VIIQKKTYPSATLSTTNATSNGLHADRPATNCPSQTWHHTFLKHLILIQSCHCYVQGVSASKTQENMLIVSIALPVLLLEISAFLTMPPSSLSLSLFYCVSRFVLQRAIRHGTHFAVHNKSMQCVHDMTTQFTPTILTPLTDNCGVAGQTFLKL